MKTELHSIANAGIALALIASMSATSLAGEWKEPSGSHHGKTYHVDCDKPNRSLARTVKRARPGATIEVKGTCNERIHITRGPLTIDGHGSAVIDGTSVPPDDVEFNGLITVDAAQGVTIRGLTVQNNPAEGVLGVGGASLTLEDVNLLGHFRGVLLSSSSAELDGVTITGGAVGFQAVTGSSVAVTGDVDVSMVLTEPFTLIDSSGEVRGGHLNIHDNLAIWNLIVVGGSTLTILGYEVSAEGEISVTSNQGAGILLANGALEIGGVTPLTPVVESIGNAGPGIIVTAGGKVLNAAGWGRIVAMNNPVGIDASAGAVIWANGGVEISGNTDGGLVASDSVVSLNPGINPISITGNGPGGANDVDLSFGARSTIGPGVTIGSPLVCDATVLSQGSATC
jgi:hypothetical protein